MRLKEIEARVIKLEAAYKANSLAGLPEEDLDRTILDCLGRLSAGHGGDIGATAGDLRAADAFANWQR